MFCDLALLTFLVVVPNPLAGNWPLGMQFRFNTFSYFYVFLATATLAYSWRTVVAMGFWTAGLWAIGVTWIYLQPETHAALSERVQAAVGADHRMFDIINPSAVGIAKWLVADEADAMRDLMRLLNVNRLVEEEWDHIAPSWSLADLDTPGALLRAKRILRGPA